MYPHERSLVKQWSGQPFVLLGVNSDADRGELQKVLESEQLTWRSWWDRSIDGPIHKQWQVTLRPAIYLLDKNGVIRYKDVLDRELDDAIARLMKEGE
jgi:hypothetical protein